MEREPRHAARRRTRRGPEERAVQGGSGEATGCQPVGAAERRATALVFGWPVALEPATRFPRARNQHRARTRDQGVRVRLGRPRHRRREAHPARAATGKKSVSTECRDRALVASGTFRHMRGSFASSICFSLATRDDRRHNCLGCRCEFPPIRRFLELVRDDTQARHLSARKGLQRRGAATRRRRLREGADRLERDGRPSPGVIACCERTADVVAALRFGGPTILRSGCAGEATASSATPCPSTG